MNRPRLPEFILASLLLLGAGTPLLVTAAAPAAHGSRAPAAPGGERPVVRWVFRDADLMSCRTPAYTLRHLRSRFGNSIELVALGIGVDGPSARAFLRAQRLDVKFVALSEAEYREHFAQPAVPGMAVLVGQHVVESYPAGPNRHYPELDEVARRVEASFLHLVHAPAYTAPAARRPS